MWARGPMYRRRKLWKPADFKGKSFVTKKGVDDEVDETFTDSASVTVESDKSPAAAKNGQNTALPKQLSKSEVRIKETLSSLPRRKSSRAVFFEKKSPDPSMKRGTGSRGLSGLSAARRMSFRQPKIASSSRVSTPLSEEELKDTINSLSHTLSNYRSNLNVPQAEISQYEKQQRQISTFFAIKEELTAVRPFQAAPREVDLTADFQYENIWEPVLTHKERVRRREQIT